MRRRSRPLMPLSCIGLFAQDGTMVFIKLLRLREGLFSHDSASSNDGRIDN